VTLDALLAVWTESPLVASVQASEGAMVDDPDVLRRMAGDSLSQGVRCLRLQGVENIRTIRSAFPVPTIGLIKRSYGDSKVYITPTLAEVDALLGLGVEVIALDGTARPRPGGETLHQLVARVHAGGALAMADCDSVESALFAVEAGADLVGTTLAGYTQARRATPGPDFDLLRELCTAVRVPVIAEGRFYEPWQAQAAIAAGARAVVVGGALNDPIKQTKAFFSAVEPTRAKCGAVDIGGTWIRFAPVLPTGELGEVYRIPTSPDRQVRLDQIRAWVEGAGVDRVGVSSGGVVDLQTATVTDALPVIPNHVGTDFRSLAKEVVALNDGLAAAWAHALHPTFAARRVATLALGTGVGCGLVDRGEIWTDARGDYPRLNQAPSGGGKSFEELLGGAALSPNPTQAQVESAIEAAHLAVGWIRAMWMPEAIVVAGSVGFAPWLPVDELGLIRSPYGPDAALRGAAALCLRRPRNVLIHAHQG
jgi:putative N-acetylmannosamine-6-phosphate epimerase